MCKTLPIQNGRLLPHGLAEILSRASIQRDLLIYIENTCSVDLGTCNTLTKVNLIEAISKTTKQRNKNYN